MKALTCEMCGSTNIIKQDGVFVCQSCGTKYSIEEARKMMVEGTVDVTGTVKVDTTDELKNLYEIARRAKDTDNIEKAEKYYDMILVKDPNSWEAYFYTTYFCAMSYKNAKISLAAEKFANCFKPTLNLIKSNLSGEKYIKAISEISKMSETISKMMSNAAIKQYQSLDGPIKDPVIYEFANHILGVAYIMLTLGNELEAIDKETHKDLIQNAWKSGIYILTRGVEALPIYDITGSKTKLKNTANKYEQKIAKLNPNYVAQTHDTSGCIVTLLMMLTGISSLAACLCFFIRLL